MAERDGAPWLARVAAVAEPALLTELVEVGEGGVDRLLVTRQADLADPRRVDHDPTVGQEVELPVRGGVPALGVARAHGAHDGGVPAEDGVDEARLPGARLAEEHGRGVGHPRSQLGDALPGGRRGDEPLEARVGVGQLRQRGIGRGDQVGLREHEDGVGPGIPRQRLAPLDATGRQRSIEPADEQHEVDVGGEQLVLVTTGCTSSQQRRARQQGHHLLAIDHEPVADRDGLDAPPKLHRPVAAWRAHLHRHTVVAKHAPRLGVGTVPGQQRGPVVGPSDGVEGGGHNGRDGNAATLTRQRRVIVVMRRRPTRRGRASATWPA